jgi:hypothetical protein
MSQHRLQPQEVKFLEEAASADVVSSNLRLREGEYQYNLAKAIASFQLELTFPDVRDLIRRLYGDEKTQDLQFVRKIQTILKKMEKSNIVKILPKKNPWQLQRYALSSFKFEDSDKNFIVFATDEEVKQTQDRLRVALTHQEIGRRDYSKMIGMTLILVASYAAVLWSLTQPTVNPIVFVSGLSIAIVSSLIEGRLLAGR